MIKLMLTLLLLLIISSCAIDIDYHMPATRFVTPETRGKLLKGHAELDVGSSHKITLAEMYENLVFNLGPAVNDKVSIEGSWAPALKAGVGLHKRIDIYVKANHDSPSTINAKWQFIGSPEMEEEKGFKMAVTAGYGHTNKSEGGINVAYGNETKIYNSDLKIINYDLSLIMGYRRNKKVLFYLNGFYSMYDTESTLSSNTEVNLSTSGIGRSYGPLVGVQLDFEKKEGETHAFFKAETGVVWGAWQSDNKKTIYPIGGSVGINW